MKFEIDVQGITTGDVIDAATCQQVIGTTEDEDPKLYALQMLQLQSQVTTEIYKLTGRMLTIRIREGCLCVLTDAQAAEWNPKVFECGLRKSRRAHRRLMYVDTGELTSEETQQHAKNVSKQAFKLLMLNRRQPKETVVTERSTPMVLKNS